MDSDVSRTGPEPAVRRTWPRTLGALLVLAAALGVWGYNAYRAGYRAGHADGALDLSREMSARGVVCTAADEPTVVDAPPPPTAEQLMIRALAARVADLERAPAVAACRARLATLPPLPPELASAYAATCDARGALGIGCTDLRFTNARLSGPACELLVPAGRATTYNSTGTEP
jgi:hypothetical protein